MLKIKFNSLFLIEILTSFENICNILNKAEYNCSLGARYALILLNELHITTSNEAVFDIKLTYIRYRAY